VLLDALQLPTLLVDEDGEIISANEAARAELALGPEANAFDHLPACPDRATLASLFADCRRHGQGQRLEYDHAGRRFELRVQPVVEEGGAVHLLAMHLEDVTARWQEAKALRRANTSAEE
ncbi:MAG: PAS domain-containing protein, partial [Gammaproteobacteria bacterium]|nr:PAS domain-containing protein [Gammaproteobacteria bacterium]NIT64628.1 PAS domain-containing protein [Gammaproteobacteria bacterium]NIY33208.1 PAS domain-containing protein [Gammaproteobacteria bacterium]